MIEKLMNLLKGKKTYIVVAIGVIINGAHTMGLINPNLLPIINVILGFLGLAALRAGVTK